MRGVVRFASVLVAVAIIVALAPMTASAASWYSWDVSVVPANPVPGQTIRLHILPFAPGDYGTQAGDVLPVRWVVGRAQFRNIPTLVWAEMYTWDVGEKLDVTTGPRRVAVFDGNGAVVVPMAVPRRATRAACMLIHVKALPLGLTGRMPLDPGWYFVTFGGGVSPVSVPLTIRSSTYTATRYHPFVLSGALSGGAVGAICTVEVKRPGCSFWVYSSNRGTYAARYGSALWSYGYLPLLRGNYSFRVRYRGSDSIPACLSSPITVAVR